MTHTLRPPRPLLRPIRAVGLVALATQLLVAGCTLRPIGDPGEPLLTFTYLNEDGSILPDEAELRVAWRSGDRTFFVASRDNFSNRLDVFEPPPADFDAAAIRLDFFMGTFDDLARLADNRTPRGAMARSRGHLWWINDAVGARDLMPAVATRALAGVDAQFVPAILVVDSGDPEARRCGDNVLADGLPGCADCAYDGPPVDGEPACCAAVRADFDACAAVVVDGVNFDQTLPVRVRVLTP